MKKPSIINGPKGIASLVFLNFKPTKSRDIKAPITNDRNMFNVISLKPNIKPNAPIKVTSPPPIPPLEAIIIMMNNPADTNNPIRLLRTCGLTP